MLFLVARCSWCVARCLSLADCCSLFVVSCCVLCVVGCVSLCCFARCVLCVACRCCSLSLVVVRRYILLVMSFFERCLLWGECWSLFVGCCLSLCVLRCCL